jgi:hypothetical protein
MFKVRHFLCLLLELAFPFGEKHAIGMFLGARSATDEFFGLSQNASESHIKYNGDSREKQ